MKLDLSVVKNESIVKFEKSLKSVKKHFENNLFLALSSAAYEIDSDKKDQVEVQLQDLLSDELNKALNSFHICMNKASLLVENSLGD
jgi:hypothetical protein